MAEEARKAEQVKIQEQIEAQEQRLKRMQKIIIVREDQIKPVKPPAEQTQIKTDEPLPEEPAIEDQDQNVPEV